MIASYFLKLCLICLVAAAAGCTSKADQVEAPKKPYQTVTGDSRRDTEVAAAENEIGLQAMAKGDLAAAEAAFKRALDADVMHGAAHNNLGKVYYAQRRLYLAAWEFQYAAKLLPRQPEPRNNLGLVLESAGKLDEASHQYDQAIELETDQPQYLGNAARVRLRRGDRDARVKELLLNVVLKDERAEWVEWAKENLALMVMTPATQPSGQASQQ